MLSFFYCFINTESERSGPLDTLPEGKLAENNNEKNGSTKAGIRERATTTEWKPSAVLDKDVVGAMEAIEGSIFLLCTFFLINFFLPFFVDS